MHWTRAIAELLSCCVAACAAPGAPGATDYTSDEGSDEGSGEYIVDGTPNCMPIDEQGCTAKETDYTPAIPEQDSYPSCISDGGTYELVADTPGSIARVEGYEEIGRLLWRSGTPHRQAFKDAHAVYLTPQGLESRVVRREDLHYPPVPQSDWNPGVEPNEQCTVASNIEKYPERCAGPAKLNHIVMRALLDGVNGSGDPRIHAARIEAAGLWFLYLSVFKEAYTCTEKGKDCDSAWAYYTGGAQANGAALGLAKMVSRISSSTHSRIFDGVLAVRCFRDLYNVHEYPSYDQLPSGGKALFDRAWGQLDNALYRGLAVLLRDRMQRLSPCSNEQVLSHEWAFLQTAGPVLDREASHRDADLGAELAEIWKIETPTLDDLSRAIDLIDRIFPCS